MTEKYTSRLYSIYWYDKEVAVFNIEFAFFNSPTVESRIVDWATIEKKSTFPQKATENKH